MDKGRQADLKRLDRDYRNARNNKQREKINEAAKKIREEQSNPVLVSAREKLLSHARNGRPEEEKKLADEIIERRQRDTKTLASFAISLMCGVCGREPETLGLVNGMCEDCNKIYIYDKYSI